MTPKYNKYAKNFLNKFSHPNFRNNNNEDWLIIKLSPVKYKLNELLL